VTVSAGVTGFRRGETVSQLLSRADSALYDAKHAGRDCVVVRD
jgi:PleD family two-component response regulator